MKFLLRALHWYEEGRIAHAIHSITRPAALRYDDLLEEIERATRRVNLLAITGSQAEQRDMHHELQNIPILIEQLREDMVRDQSLAATALRECREALSQNMTRLIKQLREDMVLNQSLAATAQLECREALSDVKATQDLTLISSLCSVDHKSSLQASLLSRDKHRFTSYRSKCPPFWTSSELHQWNTHQGSSAITIRAYFKNRFYIQDFCTNIIQQLRNSGIAVLWLLKSKEHAFLPVTEVLKSLIYQSLTLDSISSTELRLSFQMRQFLNAQFDKDYANLLGNTLERFRLVYIMVETAAMDPVSACQCRDHLQDISRGLSERGAPTIVKVMFLSYGPDTQYAPQSDSILLKIGRSHRKGTKLPSDPLPKVENREPQQSRRKFTRQAIPLRAQRRTVRVRAE